MQIIEIGLSFLEGLALIASPCILPVLPLVLSASVDGGRKRPFGIIIGFVLAFTTFAMASRSVVNALDISLDTIKYGSLFLLTVFGLILLSERLSALFSAATQRFANIGNDLAAIPKEGFFSGVGIGMLIGLIWTPCAGPILAAVLVQIIRQESNIQALFLVGSFAAGAAVPMLIISLMGREVLAKTGFLIRHADIVRKSFGVLILCTIAFIASGGDATSLFPRKETPIASYGPGLHNGLLTPYAAPEFKGIDTWLNSQPLTMQSLKGKVVLIDFWTYSCINCVRTLPYLIQWDQAYRDKGLVIIGVHSPEFEFEKDVKNIKTALASHRITYPVAVDNRLDTWTAFKNRYWPAHYLIDKEGRVVYTHFGEGSYSQTENNIRHLLGLNTLQAAKANAAASTDDQTHETYLGYSRAEQFASPEKTARNIPQSYSFPETLQAGQWALQGRWKVGGQNITAEESNSALRLNFKAGKIFLVLGTREPQPVKVTVTLNGKNPGHASGKDAPGGTLIVRGHTLYELISQTTLTAGILEIKAEQPGLEAYAFTFGK